ncbi:hypothetical protein WA538_003864, partial [Blastocystis sp. DL]
HTHSFNLFDFIYFNNHITCILFLPFLLFRNTPFSKLQSHLIQSAIITQSQFNRLQTQIRSLYQEQLYRLKRIDCNLIQQHLTSCLLPFLSFYSSLFKSTI